MASIATNLTVAVVLRLGLVIIMGSCYLGHAKSDCRFPSNWTGQWFHSGIQHPVYIHSNNISTKGRCVQTSGEKYVIENKKENCFRCVAIYEKHKNVLQYKETYCNSRDTLDNLCAEITGDAQLYSMFRIDATPVTCPLKGSFAFTYGRGYRECKNPPSQVESCTDDWRILLKFQACPDVAGTESTEEELICLATWKEGSVRYLVGKLEHSMVTTDEEKYRCFVYEKNKDHDVAGFQLAQSGDATCNGLSSVAEGSRTLKLSRIMHQPIKCQFPSWVIHTHHWHSLDGRRLFSFSHKNNTLRITNTTNENMDMRMTCASEEIMVPDKSSAVVTHVTVGCKNGYICLIFHKRERHVIELQMGQFVRSPEEACHPPHFDKSVSEFTTLVTSAPKSKRCPYLGKYNLLNAKWRQRHDHEVCQGFSTLRVGCGKVDTIELETECPMEQRTETFECHADWRENGTNYLITSVQGTKIRYCFVYTEVDKMLQFSSLQDSCKRSIQPGVSGIMAFNVTNNGHCNEMDTGEGTKVIPYILSLISSFLLCLFG